MSIKRILEIPKSRLIKKILGFDEIYTIALRVTNENKLYQGNREDKFVPIKYSEQYWYADPILFEWKGKDYLFVEEFDRTIHRGQIAVAVINKIIESLSFDTIIQEKYHMSFPMVFEWKGNLFMIPETSENRSLNIYVAKDFPFNWELVTSIKTQKMLVDTIVIEKNNNYIDLLSSEICETNSLRVRFQKHRLYFNDLNSLVPDQVFNLGQNFNLSDRNAGPIIKMGEFSIIPTQNSSSIDYGISMMFRRNINDKSNNSITSKSLNIDKIDKEDIIGIHTYSQTNRYEAIDIRYLKFSPVMQYKKIINSKKVFK